MEAKALLENMLRHFDVVNGHLQWRYVEGTTIADLEGLNFERELLPFLDKEKNAEYISYIIDDEAL